MLQENRKQVSFMSLANRDNISYEFDNFTVDLKERTLWRAGEPVALSAKAFELLTVLLENNGRVLEKSELMQRLWPETFVEEINLNVHISALRKAFGESAANYQYIETIPKRGYRFSANVKLIRAQQKAINANPQENVIALNSAAREETMANLTMIGASESKEIPITPVVEEPTRAEIGAASQKRGQKKRIGLIILALAVVSLSVLGAYLYIKQKNISASPVNPFLKITKQKLTASGKNLLPALSPDGEYVAYVKDDSGKQSLWLMQVLSKSAVQIVAPAAVTYNAVTFTPDGKTIFYMLGDNQSQDDSLYQIPLLGGTPKRVLIGVNSAISFSPDGKRFAYIKGNVSQGETSLLIAGLDGSEQVLLTRKKPEMVANWSGVAWSPDGRWIACMVRRFKAANFYMQALLVRLEDNREIAFGPDTWTYVGQIAWMKDNRGLVINGMTVDSPLCARQLWRLSYPEGEATKLTDDIINYDGVNLALQSNSLVTSTAERVSRIWLVNGKNPDEAKPIDSVLSDNFSQEFGMSWTPDGQIVYGSYQSGNADIWVMNRDGTNPRQLTSEPTRETMPEVTPDGRYIVYVSKGAGSAHLWRMDSNGENRRQLTDGQGELDPVITLDSKWVVYNGFHSGVISLSKVPIDGGEPIRLTSEWSIRPAISPDGKLIAYLKMNETRRRVEASLMPFAGGEPIKVFPNMPVPDFLLMQWSPDGQALHYIYKVDGASNIWSQPLDGGSPKLLTHFKSDTIFRFAWSQDGKTLALDRGATISDIVLFQEAK